ncbi:MAG TPA: hypothetical protein VGM63_01450 [Mucilaginibacter sp.]|jgi:hypothetical protein
MRNDKNKQQQITNIVSGPVKNDLNALQYHVKQLEVQLKRLAEAVRASRMSTAD